MLGAFHFELVAKLGASDRPDETRPIKESHGASEAEAAAAFLIYCAPFKRAVRQRLQLAAKLVPCTCHESHVPNAAEIKARRSPRLAAIAERLAAATQALEAARARTYRVGDKAEREAARADLNAAHAEWKAATAASKGVE